MANYNPLSEFSFVLSGTGHRPTRLADKSICYGKNFQDRLTEFIKGRLQRLSPDAVVSGMALGFDTALAEAALTLSIPLVAAVPFIGQESRWLEPTQQKYCDILEQAHRVVIVCPGGYSAAKLQSRNEWMVQYSHLSLAMWDGQASGTGNCVEYARQQQHGIINIWKDWTQTEP